MNVSGMNSLLAQMRSAMEVAQGGVSPLSAKATPDTQSVHKTTDFAAVLKSSLDSVAEMQNKSGKMQKSFVLGDPNVSLSDVMVEKQKAGIAFQATLQVRNKVVAAYNDIMNMQV